MFGYLGRMDLFCAFIPLRTVLFAILHKVITQYSQYTLQSLNTLGQKSYFLS